MSDLPRHVEESIQHKLPPALLHDMRTRLGHILGYSELLIEQMRDQGHEEFIPYLEKICNAGHQLLDTMTDNFESSGTVSGSKNGS